MKKTEMFSMRIEENKKAEAEALFSQLGLTLPQAINIFLSQSILVGGLPFEVRLPRFNRKTEEVFQEARNIDSGKIMTKAYRSAGELFDELEKE